VADSQLLPVSAPSGTAAADGGQQAGSSSAAIPADSSSSSSGSDTSSFGPSSGDACVTNPTSSSCADYKYSDEQATKDLEVICGSQPNLSACTLFKLCTADVDPMSIGKTPRTCTEFHLLATACKHDSIGKNETVRGVAVGSQRFSTITQSAQQCMRMLRTICSVQVFFSLVHARLHSASHCSSSDVAAAKMLGHSVWMSRCWNQLVTPAPHTAMNNAGTVPDNPAS
jgi:hypothetical protein